MAREKKFTLKFILDLYDAFLRTPDLTQVSEALGIKAGNGNLCWWIKKNPDLQLAKQLADERRGRTDTLAKYVLGKLSPEAKKIWADLEFWADGGDPPERITTRITTALRKELFLHALIRCSYNVSRACHLVGIDRAVMGSWLQEPEFLELMREIQEMKKDFFENALMDLVEERYPGAVMFVNRTINADRGYTEKIQVDHTGSVTTGIDIDSLDLDIETRRKILDAVRRKKERDLQGRNGNGSGQVVDITATRLLPAPADEEEEEE